MVGKRKNGEFSCDQCHKTFTDARYLRKHTVRIHVNGKPKEKVGKLTCSMCGKKFVRLSHLTRHQVVHLNVREWACPFCCDHFLQKAHLVTHMGRKHKDVAVDDVHAVIESARYRGDEVSFGPSIPSTSTATPICDQLAISITICAFCGSQFSTNNQLKRHREINHGVRRCLRCGDTVNGRKAMKEHNMLKHQPSSVSPSSSNNNNLFVCIHCSLTMKYRTQLDRHFISRHFIPSSCHWCDVQVQSPNERKEHTRTEHNQIVCGYCNDRFDKDKTLKNHVNSVHWKRERSKIKRDDEEKDEEEEEEEDEESPKVVEEEDNDDDREITINILLDLSSFQPPPSLPSSSSTSSLSIGSSLPSIVLATFPQLETLCVIVPSSLLSSHSLLLQLPLPYDERCLEWNGKTINILPNVINNDKDTVSTDPPID